jgi:hypothetical protein
MLEVELERFFEKFPFGWWRTLPECPTCEHRNDAHDMNCLECCPAKRGGTASPFSPMKSHTAEIGDMSSLLELTPPKPTMGSDTASVGDTVPATPESVRRRGEEPF